jgi:hypothetical protein
MKRSMFAAAAAVCTLLFGISTSIAQDGVRHFRPIEIWSCNFNDGMDMGDMDEIYEDLNEGPGNPSYSGFHLNPYFVGTRSQDNDFIYLGVWENGSDMADTDPSESDIEAAWDETADCSGFLYASTRIQEFPEDTGDSTGPFVLTVSDCAVEDGRTAGQALGGLSRFNDYKVANGSTVPTFVWFPALGDGDADFDFKLLMSFPGMQAYGNFFSWYEDNAIYQTQGAMLDGLVDCDDARFYFGRNVVDNSE